MSASVECPHQLWQWNVSALAKRLQADKYCERATPHVMACQTDKFESHIGLALKRLSKGECTGKDGENPVIQLVLDGLE